MQKSLIVGLLAALLSAPRSRPSVGAFAGYFGGWPDRSLMWVIDLLLVLPGFPDPGDLSPLVQSGTWLLFVLLLAVFSWMITSRIVRGMTMSLREREFVQAARYMGVPAAGSSSATSSPTWPRC